MMGRESFRHFVSVILAGFLLLAAAGCQGPLAPTPNFGKADRINRDAMVENPAGSIPAGGEDTQGLTTATARLVVDNYEKSQDIETQRKVKRKQAKGVDVEF